MDPDADCDYGVQQFIQYVRKPFHYHDYLNHFLILSELNVQKHT